MSNPWLEIPLADYEGHMALPQVDQARLLSDIFETLLREHRPSSVAVLGCAGGNGLERISPAETKRVVGVDLNPSYVQELRARFQDKIPDLEAIAGDIQQDDAAFRPVEFIYAALLFEYVDVKVVLARIRSLLLPGGILGTVIQLPGAVAATVTPSPFSSIQALASCLRLVPPGVFRDLARANGYRELTARQVQTPGGKHFQVFVHMIGDPRRHQLDL